MRRWALGAVALAVLAGLTLTACTSSQDKAREIREHAEATKPKPLVISKPSKNVKVGQPTMLHDQNGDAIVVPVTNETDKTLVSVPILIEIKNPQGTTVYKNDTAGIALGAALTYPYYGYGYGYPSYGYYYGGPWWGREGFRHDGRFDHDRFDGHAFGYHAFGGAGFHNGPVFAHGGGFGGGHFGGGESHR